MKRKSILIAASLAVSPLAVSLPAHAAGAHDHSLRQGGIVSVVKEIEYELVAKPDLIQLYVRDHGKAVDISKAIAKLTLLTGAEKQEIELKPVAGKLEAKGSFKVAAGSKVVAAVTVGAKTTAARFVLK